MKWTEETKKQLRDLAFAEKSNKEIAEIMDIPLTDVHAGRSRYWLTIAKVKELKGKVPRTRTQEDIKAEIKKVERAKKDAQKKIKRCENRLDELNWELFGEELIEIARS